MIKYWQIIVGAVAAFIVSWLLHSAYVTGLKAIHESQLQDAVKKISAQYEEKRIKTEDLNRALLKDKAALNRLADNLKRVRQCDSVAITSKADSGGKPSAGINARSVDAGTLIDYGRDCEAIRIEAVSMKEWIDALYR